MEDLPTPASRVELYLAKAAGMDVVAPETPESRLEQFLAAVACGSLAGTPTPIGLTEKWLSYAVGAQVDEELPIEGAVKIGAQKVDVRFLAAAAGLLEIAKLPNPQNRAEQYWVKIVNDKPSVLKTASGSNIVLKDVVRGIESLNYVYGDTAQSGTPTPTSSQAIQTVTGVQTVSISDGLNSSDYTINLPIELCRLGEYQDYIYKSGDDWYVHKAVQKLVANGSEPWSKGTNAGLVYLSSTGAVAGSANNNPVISTDYTSRFAIEDNSVFLQTVKGRLAVIDTVNATTSDAWKTYLNGHNVTFYYALETPTETKITDNALIAQLNALDGATLPKPNANVVVTGNLAASIQFSYFGSKCDIIKLMAMR